jgi:dipeptidyl aminopeptidase/acylaminoacyl peptidase
MAPKRSQFALGVVLGPVCLCLAGASVGLPGPASGRDSALQPPGEGLIPRKVLFGNPDKAAPQLSPDGKLLSYLAPVDGVLNIWVGPADKLGEAKPVTKERKRDIQSYFWAHTGRHVLYAQDTEGDENYHIWRVDLKSGDVTDLTPLKKVRAQIIAVSHRSPEEILVGLNDRDPRYHDMYRLNVVTGAKDLVQKNTEFVGFLSDDDLKIRFAFKLTADGGNAIFKPDGKGGWTDFIKIPMADTLTTSPAGFDKTGTILYLLDSRGRDTAALATLDLKTDKLTTVAENPRADATSVLTHPRDNTIHAVQFNYDRVQWVFKDAAVEADFKGLSKVADGEISIASQTLDDQIWLVAFALDNGPKRFYVYDRPTKKAQFLFTNRKDLEGRPLQKMHARIIKSRDGLNLVSYLTLPPGSDLSGTGKPSQPVPLVLYVHGGPWARDQWGYNGMHQFLANRGYAVLSVNFRGSTGFGKNFINAANKEWAGKMQEDLIDAVDWAIKDKIADPNKVAIFGGSYGGYATLVGMTFTPERFACGVDLVGPSNLVTLLKSVPPYWEPALNLFKSRVGDHTTEDGKKLLNERSPLDQAHKIKRPLLIGQGANDPRVKQAESDQIVQAMQSKKIPVTYLVFPDEGHGFVRPANNLAFNAVMEAFLAKNLGGRFEPIGEAFEGSTITVPAGADDVPGLPGKLPKRQE